MFATHNGTKCIACYLCFGCCLEEVIINEAIEDGVGAGGGDAQHVAEQEGDHQRLCIITIFSFLFQFNEDQCETSITSLKVLAEVWPMQSRRDKLHIQ